MPHSIADSWPGSPLGFELKSDSNSARIGGVKLVGLLRSTTSPLTTGDKWFPGESIESILNGSPGREIDIAWLLYEASPDQLGEMVSNEEGVIGNMFPGGRKFMDALLSFGTL